MVWARVSRNGETIDWLGPFEDTGEAAEAYFKYEREHDNISGNYDWNGPPKLPCEHEVTGYCNICERQS